MAIKRVAIIFHRIYSLAAFKLTAVGISEQSISQKRQFQIVDLGPTPQIGRANVEALSRQSVDGAIAIGLLEEDVFVMETLARLGIPAVHAGELYTDFPIHEVRAPNVLIGQIAAQHLLERGLRRFAFVGDTRQNSLKRCEGFAQTLAESGNFHFDKLMAEGVHLNGPLIAEFLAKLSLPIGVMANNDEIGWLIAREALLAGIIIPDQLALIGVGNDDPWCMLATPPLSSVAVPGRPMGQQALAMLDNLMNGEPTPLTVDVLTKQVVERRSTGMVHADNPEIAAAIAFIRQRRGVGITVRNVADFAGVSISKLERGVKDVLGRTPRQEILRLRFDIAKELLANTDMPMKTVAVHCGFAAGKRFSTALRAATGMSPSQYRAKHRVYNG